MTRYEVVRLVKSNGELDGRTKIDCGNREYAERILAGFEREAQGRESFTIREIGQTPENN